MRDISKGNTRKPLNQKQLTILYRFHHEVCLKIQDLRPRHSEKYMKWDF